MRPIHFSAPKGALFRRGSVLAGFRRIMPTLQPPSKADAMEAWDLLWNAWDISNRHFRNGTHYYGIYYLRVMKKAIGKALSVLTAADAKFYRDSIRRKEAFVRSLKIPAAQIALMDAAEGWSSAAFEVQELEGPPEQATEFRDRAIRLLAKVTDPNLQRSVYDVALDTEGMVVGDWTSEDARERIEEYKLNPPRPYPARPRYPLHVRPEPFRG